jgi:hypothetical protein
MFSRANDIIFKAYYTVNNEKYLIVIGYDDCETVVAKINGNDTGTVEFMTDTVLRVYIADGFIDACMYIDVATGTLTLEDDYSEESFGTVVESTKLARLLKTGVLL